MQVETGRLRWTGPLLHGSRRRYRSEVDCSRRRGRTSRGNRNSRNRQTSRKLRDIGAARTLVLLKQRIEVGHNSIRLVEHEFHTLEFGWVGFNPLGVKRPERVALVITENDREGVHSTVNDRFLRASPVESCFLVERIVDSGNLMEG